jgi:hypothetical protein
MLGLIKNISSSILKKIALTEAKDIGFYHHLSEHSSFEQFMIIIKHFSF